MSDDDNMFYTESSSEESSNEDNEPVQSKPETQQMSKSKRKSSFNEDREPYKPKNKSRDRRDDRGWDQHHYRDRNDSRSRSPRRGRRGGNRRGRNRGRRHNDRRGGNRKPRIDELSPDREIYYLNMFDLQEKAVYEDVLEHFREFNIVRLITSRDRWHMIDLCFTTQEDAIEALKARPRQIGDLYYKIRPGNRNENYEQDFALRVLEGSYGYPKDPKFFTERRGNRGRGRGRGRRGGNRGRGRNRPSKFDLVEEENKRFLRGAKLVRRGEGLAKKNVAPFDESAAESRFVIAENGDIVGKDEASHNPNKKDQKYEKGDFGNKNQSELVRGNNFDNNKNDRDENEIERSDSRKDRDWKNKNKNNFTKKSRNNKFKNEKFNNNPKNIVLQRKKKYVEVKDQSQIEENEKHPENEKKPAQTKENAKTESQNHDQHHEPRANRKKHQKKPYRDADNSDSLSRSPRKNRRHNYYDRRRDDDDDADFRDDFDRDSRDERPYHYNRNQNWHRNNNRGRYRGNRYNNHNNNYRRNRNWKNHESERYVKKTEYQRKKKFETNREEPEGDLDFLPKKDYQNNRKKNFDKKNRRKKKKVFRQVENSPEAKKPERKSFFKPNYFQILDK